MDLQTKLETAQDRAYELQDLLKGLKQKTRDTTVKELAKEVEKLPKTSIRQRKVFKGHSSKVLDISWAPESENQFLSIGQDGKMLVWNSESQVKEHVIMLKSNWMMCCDYGKESMVACGGLDNIGSIYNLVEVDTETASAARIKGVPDHRAKVELVGHEGYLSGIRLIESSQKAITSSGDGTCMLWDVNGGNGKSITTFKGHSSDVCCITNLTGTQMFISSGCDGISRLWDTRIKGDEHNCSRIFLGHSQEITCNDSFPDGNAFVSGSEDGSCRIYDLRADRTMQVLNDDKRNGKAIAVTSCSFTISGRGIIFGQENNDVQSASTVSNVLMEKDAKGSNHMFGNLNIWDVLCGEKIGILLGAHNGKITSIKTSPIGNCMVSSSWDGVVKLWA